MRQIFTQTIFKCCLVVFLLFIIYEGVFAQTKWMKYLGNPIMDTGPSGSWDDSQIYYPYVIFDDMTYRMWYSAWDGNNARMGYATSVDGMKWTKYAGNPVMDLGPAGSWINEGINAGPVLVEGDTLKMWYFGDDGSQWLTGLAKSVDGISWTRYDDPATNSAPYSESDPALQTGPEGSWDDRWVAITSILVDGELYKGWYLGYNGTTARIGYVTSEDGIHWTKYNDPSTTDTIFALSDPVLDVGPPGSWDEIGIYGTQVILMGETYHLWYEGSNGINSITGYATSNDGIQWTKYASNPVLDKGEAGSWDGQHAYVSAVLFEDPIYKMWYTGNSGGDRIGYAVDFSRVVHSDSIGLNFTYTPSGTDTLKIDARIINPENHTMTAKAQFIADDSVVDSTDLVHQEAELWSAQWAVPEGEKTYNVAIKTVDQESGRIHEGIVWNIESFTTIGPVVYDSCTISYQNQFNRWIVTLYLKNEGQIATATNITAELLATDTVTVTDIITGDWDTVNIDAGDRVEGEQFFLIYTAGHPDTLFLNMKIYSNGYHYWSDTFSILIEEDTTGMADQGKSIPTEFGLSQNYPNPFNPITVIRWQLPISSDVELSVYNLLGQKVAMLVAEKQAAGFHQVEWDASLYSSGIYYYQLEAGEFREVKKMVLLK